MVKPSHLHKLHAFECEEIAKIRLDLLKWFSENGRDLLWRRYQTEKDLNKKAYAIWVSEVMLQQTQVSRVTSYYKKWMEEWPTVESLAEASLEEVNQVWSGLGYYSRAKSLHTAAKKVVNELGGIFPTTALSLEKELCGVGKYTSGAIASIAFNEPIGAVDGNVIRVITRLRCIGADVTQQKTVDHIWSLANELVSPEEPGDFNQALMELGATICLPKNPNCTKFPECGLCLTPDNPWDDSCGVMNYPLKKKKVLSRDETRVVAVIHNDKSKQYLIMQRPEKGLLANLWEFPSIILPPGECNGNQESEWKSLSHFLHCDMKIEKKLLVNQVLRGEVNHVFSHINMTLRVFSLKVKECPSSLKLPSCYNDMKWVSEKEFNNSAISNGMKKVFKVNMCGSNNKKSTRTQSDKKNQLSMDSFVQVSTNKRKRTN